MSRDLDLVVYGATGFTGRLVAEHLRDTAPADLRWGIAGRNEAKLRSTAEDLGVDVPVVVADSGDPASITAMAQQAAVVCTTVGPYARYGEPVVAACAANGTDYVDLTGEVHWIREMVDRHASAAEESGARILHACGFDSIPSDMGTWYAQQQMRERHGVWASRVAGRLKAARGGASGATIASGVDLIESARESAAVRRVLADPYSLNPPKHRSGPPVSNRNTPFRDTDFDRWSAPFIMSAVNARIVRRSAALIDEWGPDFTYDEAMLAPTGPASPVVAAGIAAGMGLAGAIGGLVTSLPRGRALLDRILPDPGTGPDDEARMNGFWDMRLHAEHPTDPDKSFKVKVVGDRDPGYGSTSRMLGECAVALARGESTVGGGSWTPASALGPALLQRLPANAGVTFEVLG